MTAIEVSTLPSPLRFVARLGVHHVLSALFALAILIIGLDQYRPILGGVGNFSDILCGVVFAVGGIVWFLRMDAGRFRDLVQAVRPLEPFLWGGLLFTAGGAIASLGSDAPGPSWRVTAKHFIMLCVWIPWATVAIQRYLSVPIAYTLYVGGIALIAVETFSDLLLGTRFGGRLVSTPVYMVNFENIQEGLRYGGPTGHPNSLGYLSAMGLLLCIATIMRANTRRAVVPLLASVACAGGLLVSGSRGAFLGVVIGSAIIFALGTAGERRRVVVVLAGGLAALTLVSRNPRWGPQMNPLNRLRESIQPRRSYEADWQRTHDLRLSGRLLSKDPLTGYGMENIDAIEPPTKVAFHLPHFILLQSWVAGGMVGLVGNLWLYTATLLLGWRAVRHGHPMAAGLLAACTAFIAMDMVAPGLDQRFKWFPAALLFATLRPPPAGLPSTEFPSSIA
jgi:hypothetical protein